MLISKLNFKKYKNIILIYFLINNTSKTTPNTASYTIYEVAKLLYKVLEIKTKTWTTFIDGRE